MKKMLIAAGVITAALSVASPALDCAAPNSQAVGHPATGKAQTAFSNTVIAEHNHAQPNCQ